MVEYKLIDVKDKILGRACTQIAKKALLGEYIVVINAKDCVISGEKSVIQNKYLEKLNIHTATNPRRGPFWPRRPDMFFRKVVWGMLPKKRRGRDALKRIHVYITDIPDRFKNRYQTLTPLELHKADVSRLQYKYINLETLCTRIGWKKISEAEA